MSDEEGVPSRLRGALRALGAMSDAEFTALTELLAAAAPQTDDELVAKVRAARPGREDNVAEVIRMVTSLAATSDDEPAELTGRMLAALTGEPGEQGLVEPPAVEKVQSRVKALLAIDSIRVAGRATRLFIDHERTFCSGRMITDLRPVFGRKVTDPPAGVGIVHMLRLSFHDDSPFDTRDFYVAVHSEGLLELKGQVERALEKERTLKEMMAKLGVPVIDTRFHDD